MDVFFNKINLDLLKNKTPSPYSCHLYKLLKNADVSQKCNIKIERNIPGNRKPKKNRVNISTPKYKTIYIRIIIIDMTEWLYYLIIVLSHLILFH